MNNKNQYESIFRALSDGHRLTILRQLAQREMNAGEILETVDVVQSTLSHHMKTLCESGLVVPRKKGKWTYYTLDEEILKDAAAYLVSICPEGNAGGNASDDLPEKANADQAWNEPDDLPGKADEDYLLNGQEDLSAKVSKEQKLPAEPKAEEIIYTTTITEDTSKKKSGSGKSKEKEEKGKTRDKDRIKTKDKEKDKSKDKAKDKIKDKSRSKNREKGKDGRGKK